MTCAVQSLDLSGLEESVAAPILETEGIALIDRKSTRLNSSH